MTTTERHIGRYRVLAVLGRGAMGEVVRARDERLGRDVAIKRVKNLFGGVTASFHARFDAEARALAALAHPGVVQVYDIGIDGDDPYLVMELVEGPTLRAYLAERGSLSEREVCALGIQLARALEAAHARGIVHRDVKPGNVLRSPDGVWKLADFGVAHVPDSETTIAGQFVGTPAYAAPEALTLGRFGPASDVFGLAATLLEAATAIRPRGDATLAELIRDADHPLLDPRALPPGLGALGPPLAAALAVDPASRPTAAALADLLAGLGSTEASTRTTAASSRPRPRWPWLVAAGVAGIVFVAVASSGGDDGPPPAPRWAPAAAAPQAFAAPPDLSDKAARDWRKIADKVHARDYAEALDRLVQFERKHGRTPESAALRDWLAGQGPADHD